MKNCKKASGLQLCVKRIKSALSGNLFRTGRFSSFLTLSTFRDRRRMRYVLRP
ncbi:hypothetical protein CLOLEP_03940 [[Clostridium] leptum DSM 753]|uniref:Uncharacterized protein n=1 Tax=[Clostridium] leptum DSM 753 TaxID=428125 RepID=A7VZB1_9FIRM|nr:hypothetical protein CLOLEP_03940 [[Clostridium] leptum DSM 753]